MRITIHILVLFFSYSSFCQTIEIGQQAHYVKTVIEWSTSKQNKSNPLNKAFEPYWTWDSKYIDGKLLEVSQCYQNQYLIDFQIKTDYCERYIMKNDTLHHTIKEFKNISLDQIKAKYTSLYAIYKIDEMYFDNSLSYYYTFYLNQSNLACAEYHKTNLNEWDKTTQKRFATEKKVIEKKHFEATMDNIMSGKKYDKEINEMEAELKYQKAEKSQDSIGRETIIPIKLNRNRKILDKPHPIYKCNEWGKVVVAITVDSSGKVIDAVAGDKGTTNFTDCLLEAAKLAALHTRWEPLYSSNEQQIGTLVYNFKIGD